MDKIPTFALFLRKTKLIGCAHRTRSCGRSRFRCGAQVLAAPATGGSSCRADAALSNLSCRAASHRRAPSAVAGRHSTPRSYNAACARSLRCVLPRIIEQPFASLFPTRLPSLSCHDVAPFSLLTLSRPPRSLRAWRCGRDGTGARTHARPRVAKGCSAIALHRNRVHCTLAIAPSLARTSPCAHASLSPCPSQNERELPQVVELAM